ncbi:MAG: hypothetical protein Q9M91_04430 [Candidatus Dojkabacteria bacterium]|nr:hypothetical protein [Candidatus Dojkabacteria bacterium]
MLIINDQDLQIINYSSLALTLHQGTTSDLTWIVDAVSGEPVSGAKIYLSNGSFLGSTGSDGVLLSKGLHHGNNYSKQDLIIYAEYKGRFGILDSNWSNGMGGYWYPKGRATLDPIIAYVYTDRTLYKPGDTVNFKGYVREWTDTGMVVPNDGESATSYPISSFPTSYPKFNSDSVKLNIYANGINLDSIKKNYDFKW